MKPSSETPVVSVCLTTYDRPLNVLRQSLVSLLRQEFDLPTEIILVDDGSPNSRSILELAKALGIQYSRIQREPGFRNPCTARNQVARMAKGPILVFQNDDIIHHSTKNLYTLVSELRPGTFTLATVWALNQQGRIIGQYTGLKRQKPYFFLGALWRNDFYAVGGYDLDFAAGPCYDDAWLGECLRYGRQLSPVFCSSTLAYHLWHGARYNLKDEAITKCIYEEKHLKAMQGKIPWLSSSGPWETTTDVDPESLFRLLHEVGAYFGGKTPTETICGPGSTLQATARLRQELPKLIQKLNVQTLIDLCCGDCYWISHVDLAVTYLGADCIREMIEENQRKYSLRGWQFLHLNILKDAIPKADLILCRDCLVHFSPHDVLRALSAIYRSGTRWLLTTTFPEHTVNPMITTGSWAPYNLQAEPFNLPPPVELIRESPETLEPIYQDKSLGLWDLHAL